VVAYVTALLILVVYIALGIGLYLFLAKQVSRSVFSALSAAVLLWVVLAISPWVLTWAGFRLGWNIYEAFPALRDPGWDVGLALVTGLSMVLCYGVGFIGGCIAIWRLRNAESPSR
jgi:hypothetical protein